MDNINDALIACVKALGGSKQVGPLLWPDKTPEAAQRLLLDCLNEDRAAHLTPDQVVMVLRLARARSCHVGVDFILSSLGYAPTLPVEPKDEAAELQREYIQAIELQRSIAERIERAVSRLNMRAVA